MGKREADIDGIKYYFDPNVSSRGKKGTTIFLVPCVRCGELVKRKSYGRDSDVMCDACRIGLKRKQDEFFKTIFDGVETKGEKRFNNAVEEIRKQVRSFAEYEGPVAKARKAAEKFGSIPEAMVAIELVRLGYKPIPQQKVGKYRVDFYVPDQFVIEVDGGVYHQDPNEEREATIQLSLGLGVKIIHVPAEYIRNHIRQLKKIIDVSMNKP